MTVDRSSAIEQTRRWLIHSVLGLDLCPFAKKPFIENSIRFVEYQGMNTPELDQLITEELTTLDHTPSDSLSTTLIVIPNMYGDFLDFVDRINSLENLLIKTDYWGVFQIASFHPQYQFANTDVQDITNCTNRSPYPIIHILREADIDWAAEHYEGIDDIPTKNQQTLKTLGWEAWKTLSKQWLG